MKNTGLTHEGGIDVFEAHDAAILDQLTAFDPAIGERINAIQLGLSPNGHSPNGVLSEAIAADASDEARLAFRQEYEWAKAVAVFPYRNRRNEHKDYLMAAADDALFDAAETYDINVEPNFLVHLSKHAQQKLCEVYGQPPEATIIRIEDFDELVEVNN